MKYGRPSLFLALFCLAFLGGVTAGGADENTPAVSVKYSVSRDYGYFVGDLVEVFYWIFLPDGHFLDEKSLPKAGEAAGEWLDIRRVKHEATGSGGPRVYSLTLIYQVFSAAERAQPYEIPAIPFSHGPGENPSAQSSVLPSVPILISPLTPPEAQPLPAILRFWTSSTPQIIRAVGVVLVLGAAVPLAFRNRRRIHIHSPFGTAARKIAHHNDPAAALVLFRSALNEKAGKPIFPENLEDFFRVFPRGLTYEREVREMMSLSEEIIFNPRYVLPMEGLATRVAAVLKDLRRAERWA